MCNCDKNMLEDFMTDIVNMIDGLVAEDKSNKKTNKDEESTHYKNPFKQVFINEKKRVVVVEWFDGSKTKVHCDEADTWDVEKAVMAAYMKRSFDNKSYYNDYLRKAIKNAINHGDRNE